MWDQEEKNQLEPFTNSGGPRTGHSDPLSAPAPLHMLGIAKKPGERQHGKASKGTEQVAWQCGPPSSAPWGLAGWIQAFSAHRW